MVHHDQPLFAGSWIRDSLPTLTQRFFAARYHEAIAYTGETYSSVVDGLSRFFSSSGGLGHAESVSYAKQYILEHVNMEAYISGINDVFFVAFITTLLAVIPMFFLKTKRK